MCLLATVAVDLARILQLYLLKMHAAALRKMGHPQSTQHVDMSALNCLDCRSAPHAVLAGRGPHWRNDDALAHALQYHAQDAEVGADSGGRVQSRPPRAASGARGATTPGCAEIRSRLARARA